MSALSLPTKAIQGDAFSIRSDIVIRRAVVSFAQSIQHRGGRIESISVALNALDGDAARVYLRQVVSPLLD